MNGSLNIAYEYDEIGNLKLSEENGVQDTIKWTVYGKVAQVIRKKGMDFMTINYRYDGSGNRVMKLIEKRIKHEITFTTTHYIRDATGNIMATYTNRQVKELNIYGSSRLGAYNIPYEPHPTAPNKQIQKDDFHKLILGRRYYELSNHLGNVLAVISDKKILNGNTFEADVVATNDYYPFGMTIASRTFQTEEYRFGFNGKENDKDFGTGIQDYGFRLYDKRIARFLSQDPLFKSYPWYTPYQFAGNKPIWAIDLDGLEEVVANENNDPENIFHGATSEKNLIIIVKGFDWEKTWKALETDDSNKNWAYASANDLHEAQALVTQYAQQHGGKLNNIVIRSHGANAQLQLYPNKEGRKSITRKGVKRYTDIQKGVKANQLKSHEMTGDALEALKEIAGAVADGGNLVLTGCHGGKCLTDVERRSQLPHLLFEYFGGVNQKFALWMNQDWSTAAYQYNNTKTTKQGGRVVEVKQETGTVILNTAANRKKMNQNTPILLTSKNRFKYGWIKVHSSNGSITTEDFLYEIPGLSGEEGEQPFNTYGIPQSYKDKIE